MTGSLGQTDDEQSQVWDGTLGVVQSGGRDPKALANSQGTTSTPRGKHIPTQGFAQGGLDVAVGTRTPRLLKQVTQTEW